jgi:phosphatidylglycerophosphate synthase
MKKIEKIIDRTKKTKNKILMPVAKILKKYLRISSGDATTLSLICGILAAVYVFYPHNFFIYFILASVAFDIIDGTLAILENKNKEEQERGWILDMFSDRMVVILVLLSITVNTDLEIAKNTLLLYIFTKGLVIYERGFLGRKLEITYMDRLAFIFFIFEKYEMGIWLIMISLIFNLLEIMAHFQIGAKKRN